MGPEMFLHVANSANVVGLRRGKTGCKQAGAVRVGQRGRSCPVEMGSRADAEGPVLPLGCHCASLDWTGHLACLAEVHGLFRTERVQ